MKDVSARLVEKNRVTPFIFYTQRPVGVVSGVTNASDCFLFLPVFDIDLREMPINLTLVC